MTLTPRLRRAIESAQQHAKSLGHVHSGSVHLLFGLAHLGVGVHFAIMESHGLSEVRIQSFLLERAPKQEQVEISFGFLVWVSAARTIKSAEKGARMVDGSLIGTEHLLMALLSSKQEDLCELYARYDVEIDVARRELIRACGWSTLRTA